VADETNEDVDWAGLVRRLGKQLDATRRPHALAAIVCDRRGSVRIPTWHYWTTFAGFLREDAVAGLRGMDTIPEEKLVDLIADEGSAVRG
jgi:hypothetical protein